MIDIEDIAVGLSRESRFCGQLRWFYSVGQHSVIMSTLVPPEHALEALLHDAHEAYVKDLPTPLKRMCPEYKAILSTVDSAIRLRFGLPEHLSEEVDVADARMYVTEKEQLKVSGVSWEDRPNVVPYSVQIIANPNHDSVADAFLKRFHELTK
jgi:hypothetical protein